VQYAAQSLENATEINGHGSRDFMAVTVEFQGLHVLPDT